MNDKAIQEFNNYEGDIEVPSGVCKYRYSIFISYPKFVGKKKNMYPFYVNWATEIGHTINVLNCILMDINERVIYLHHEEDANTLTS